MQEWGLCIFCNEVHLSIIGYKKKKKTYWHVDDHRHIVNVSSDSKQRGRVVRTTWEYFIVEVAGKRQPNKVLLMGGGEGRGGRKSSWGSTGFNRGVFWVGGGEYLEGGGEWQVYLHTGQFILRVWSSLSHPRYSDTFVKEEPQQQKNASSQCTFINKIKTQPAFTVMTRMLIKYWKEIIKWFPNATFFWYKAKAAVSLLITQWPKVATGLTSWTPAKICMKSAFSYFFLLKKQTKVKLLCTVLHNNDGVPCCYMITHLKACWIAIMPLFE